MLMWFLWFQWLNKVYPASCEAGKRQGGASAEAPLKKRAKCCGHYAATGPQQCHNWGCKVQILQSAKYQQDHRPCAFSPHQSTFTGWGFAILMAFSCQKLKLMDTSFMVTGLICLGSRAWNGKVQCVGLALLVTALTSHPGWQRLRLRTSISPDHPDRASLCAKIIGLVCYIIAQSRSHFR